MPTILPDESGSDNTDASPQEDQLATPPAATEDDFAALIAASADQVAAAEADVITRAGVTDAESPADDAGDGEPLEEDGEPAAAELSVQTKPTGRSGKVIASVFVSNQLLDSRQVDLGSPNSRTKFVTSVAERFDIVDAEELSQILLNEAAQWGQKSIGGAKSQASCLLELVNDAELFHDGATPYARFPVGDCDQPHHEVAALGSSKFARWLSFRSYSATGRVPGKSVLDDAVGVLAGRAIHVGAQRDVRLRTAEHEGKFYLDLADEHWRVIEIDAEGWRILDSSPVMFRRSDAMQALPAPVAGGSVEELREFVNVTDADWPLALSWLGASYRPPVAPYPVLRLSGVQGVGKSTQGKIWRSLVDPSQAPMIGAPRNARTLLVAAANQHVLALDNLSTLPDWLSDFLCQIASGTGILDRRLFSDLDVTVARVQNPIILTSVEDLIVRGDLLDRSLLLELQPINNRRTEAAIYAGFSEAKPRILGAILASVSEAMRTVETVQLRTLPRMADFAKWAVALVPSMGIPAGSFMLAFQENLADGQSLALEASPIGAELVRLLEIRRQWTGTASQLLDELRLRANIHERSMDGWPRSARSMSSALRRLMPALRAAGYTVEFTREGHNRDRRWTLGRATAEAVTPPPPTTSPLPATVQSARQRPTDPIAAARHRRRPPR